MVHDATPRTHGDTLPCADTLDGADARRRRACGRRGTGTTRISRRRSHTTAWVCEGFGHVSLTRFQAPGLAVSRYIVGTLLDALLGMLRPAFVFVRLNDPETGR